MLQKSSNLVKCIKFSFNLVEKNYQKEEVDFFVENTIKLLDLQKIFSQVKLSSLCVLLGILVRGVLLNSVQELSEQLLQKLLEG